jgi:hypothetical protein
MKGHPFSVVVWSCLKTLNPQRQKTPSTGTGYERGTGQSKERLPELPPQGWVAIRAPCVFILRAHGYDVFMDVESLGGGAFSPVIEHQIPVTLPQAPATVRRN